jgi:3'(2'), 5'-bisphosphate nucleotidase
MMNQLLSQVITIAEEAGAAILTYWRNGSDLKINLKADESPVTAADMAAHEIIEKGLQNINTDWPVLSEESQKIPFEVRNQWQRYWLVDPLDGTKEFIADRPEFTVNIALIDNHVPILGVVFAPAVPQQKLYYAAQGLGAFLREDGQTAKQIHTRPYNNNAPIVAISRRHSRQRVEQLLAHLPNATTTTVLGSSLKLCIVAEGGADFYLRLGPTCEWDTAAGHCVVKEAGGEVVDLNLKPLQYNCKDSLLNPEFLVLGDHTHTWTLLIDKVKAS